MHPTKPSLDYHTRVYSDCRGGSLPAATVLVPCNDAGVDPSRAPAGKYVMKIIANNVTYVIRGDATGKIEARTWEAAKEPYADHLLKLIEAHYIYRAFGT